MLNMWITIISYFDSIPDDGGYTEYKVEIQKESEDRDMRRGEPPAARSSSEGAPS